MKKYIVFFIPIFLLLTACSQKETVEKAKKEQIPLTKEETKSLTNQMFGEYTEKKRYHCTTKDGVSVIEVKYRKYEVQEEKLKRIMKLKNFSNCTLVHTEPIKKRY